MIYVATLKPDNDAIIDGKSCITNMQELYECILYHDTKEIVITKEFAEEYFTPSGLQDFVANAQSLNSRIVINVNSVMSIFDESAVKDLLSLRTIEELIYIVHKKPKETMDTIRTLCKSYLSTSSETLIANNKIATLHLENSNLQKKYQNREEDFASLMIAKNDYEAKLKTLIARINFKYEKDLKEETMFKVSGSRYDKILYIKEITRVHYTDTLVYYLQELLKTFYGVPARLVVIEPYYAYKNARLYPTCKPHYDLTYNDVYKENIFMAGLQPRLMEDILQNPYNMNYLIVLDRSGYAVPHIDGDSVEMIYCASDPKDTEGLALPLDRIISYSEATMFIPFIPGFNMLSTEERIQKYSSMSVTKKLLEFVERK